VRNRVSFRANSSIGNTSAVDTLVEEVGVCRDFAHLMIALCRALNIPARFGTGRDAADAAFATIFGAVTGSAPVISVAAVPNARTQGVNRPGHRFGPSATALDAAQGAPAHRRGRAPGQE
jgi:transglutaminase-like putative cysteine protease